MSPFLLHLPLAQSTSETWLTTWLTPIWFLAAGTAIGILALLIFVAVFRLLSFIPIWEWLSHGPQGHVVAAVITAALATSIWWNLPPDMVGNAELQEPLLLGIALVLLCAIVGWAVVFCCSKQAAKNALATLTEGAAGYMSVALLVVILIGGAAWAAGAALGNPIVDGPIAAFRSIPQLFSTGNKQVVVKLDSAHRRVKVSPPSSPSSWI